MEDQKARINYRVARDFIWVLRAWGVLDVKDYAAFMTRYRG